MKRKDYLLSGLISAIILLSSYNLNSQNIVLNGGFENWTDGSPDDWTTIDAGITVTEESTIIHGDSKSAKVDVTTATQGNTDLRQNVNVTNGVTYNVSVWVYHTDQTVKARLYVADYETYSNNTLTDQWQEITYEYTASSTESIEIGLRFYDQSGFSGSSISYIDDYTMILQSSGPIISNITHTPSVPNSGETTSVSADITDTDGISNAELHWGTTSGSLGTTINMSISSGDTYTTDTPIPAQANGTSVYYEVYAIDNNSDATTSDEQNYTVVDISPEPTNYPTDFTAVANGSYSIINNWIDATGAQLPEKYLILINTTGTFTLPIDGIPVDDDTDITDGEGAINIAQGTETYTWNNLNTNTQYFTVIYPYTNTSTNIDYKADVSAPTAYVTTDIAPIQPNAWINEFHYDNASTDVGEFVEIVIENAGTYSLSDFQLDLYNGENGESYGSTTVNLINTGSSIDDFAFYYWDKSGIQNGPDGIALSYQGTLIASQFLSYEGSFIATDGPASGSTSTNIGVSESSSTPEGYSLQLKWAGTYYNQFIWKEPNTETKGALNHGQYFGNYSTFSGNTSNTWNESANWTNSTPGDAMDVLIPQDATNFPTISASASCNDIIIESNSSGDASLIGQENLSVSGSTTIQRYATAGMWHGISAPSSGNTFQNLYFDGNPDVWAASYNEATNGYVYANNTNTLLGDMKGWMTWIDGATAQTFEFTGTLRNGPVSTSLTNTGPNEEHGYNFVGNPYPSAINWDATSGWTKTNIDAGIWIYDPTSSNFVTYNVSGGTGGGNQYIPMGQGFFVQITDEENSGTLEATSAVQVHNDETFRTPQANTTPNLLKLKVADGELYDEAIIHLNATATVDYDGQLDMHKLFSFNAENPQIFSTANSFMTVNCLPLETSMVEMDVSGKDGNELTISIAENNDFQEVYLSDEFTGTQTNLIEESYTFMYSEAVTDRFRVYLGTVDVTENTAETVMVFSYDNNIRIVSANTNANVVIINMLGQKVATAKVNSGTKDITMYKSGYYMVIITTENGQKAHKVMVNL